jgi:hypothetical protein
MGARGTGRAGAGSPAVCPCPLSSLVPPRPAPKLGPSAASHARAAPPAAGPFAAAHVLTPAPPRRAAQVTPLGFASLGVGPYLTLLTAIAWVAALASAAVLFVHVRRGRQGAGDVELGPAGAEGGEEGVGLAAGGRRSSGKPLHRTSLDIAVEGLQGVRGA